MTSLKIWIMYIPELSSSGIGRQLSCGKRSGRGSPNSAAVIGSWLCSGGIGRQLSGVGGARRGYRIVAGSEDKFFLEVEGKLHRSKLWQYVLLISSASFSSAKERACVITCLEVVVGLQSLSIIQSTGS